MSDTTNIVDLEMTNPWMDIAKALQGKSEAELTALGFTSDEISMIEVYTNPVQWASTHLHWDARDYQNKILQTGASAKQTVLRLGRRLGKTECMCILIWWHAFVQPNKGPNNQYDILIITPYETQIDLIFKRLQQLLDMSPELKASVKRDIKHTFELKNGTVIKGLTAGTKSSSGAANTRGQRADLIVLDEVDYMGEDDITNILNIRNEAPERIKIVAASTPSGRRASFYKWCVSAPTNGWREVYAPSTVNPEMLKYNPDTGRTYLEDLKEELTEVRYVQEVMAEFGDEEMGVYQKRHVDEAVKLGKQLAIIDNKVNMPKRGPRILGVDWDKYGASTNMVGVEYITELNTFAMFNRSEIPSTEFTYDIAVKKIIELNNRYDYDYIYIDAGHGEMQIEQLKLHGMKHPETGLHKKIVRVNFSEKVKVRDPITKIRESKDIKPFMVNNVVLLFERGQFAFNPTDKETIKQFEDYHIERFGTNGRPVYTEKNEHIHDCIMLAIHGFTMKYNDMFKVKHSSFIGKIDAFSKTPESVPVRGMGEQDTSVVKAGEGVGMTPASAIKYIGIQPARHAGSRRATGRPSRKSF
jgi:replicative DNA helicase